MKRYILEIIVFLCGAVVMVLELVGSRVLAPYLGSSIIVWTSLIGIILGCLSLGYWWGGRVADQNPTYRTFSAIILISAVLTGSIAFLKEPVLERLQTGISDVQISAPLATLILFGLPSILLGMVTPYAVRLKMNDVEHSGRTVGRLYAISTVGSIVGTFLAGYWLIVIFGSTRILLVLAIVLLATSTLAWWRGRLATNVMLMAVLVVSFGIVHFNAESEEIRGIYDVDTLYSRVRIYDSVLNDRPVRFMTTNPAETQSAIYLDGDDLVLRYTRFYRLAMHFVPDAERALMIGGAGYSYPRDFLKSFPRAKMDVVEIDPMMTSLARRHFGLKDGPRLTIHHEDGRAFLNKSAEHYDAIFSDAFTSLYTIPFQLTTVESVRRLYMLLNDGGAVFANIISAIDGEGGRFLRAEYATFKAVFPVVYLFAVREPEDGGIIQNYVLVALKSTRQVPLTSPEPELQRYLQHRVIRDIPLDTPMLTDDHAPVDNYIVRMVRTSDR